MRHRWKVEGLHGEAKSCHGLTRAVRRGLSNMQIQAYLTAAAINLKRLVAWIAALLCALWALVAEIIDERTGDPDHARFCKMARAC